MLLATEFKIDMELYIEELQISMFDDFLEELLTCFFIKKNWSTYSFPDSFVMHSDMEFKLGMTLYFEMLKIKFEF